MSALRDRRAHLLGTAMGRSWHICLGGMSPMSGMEDAVVNDGGEVSAVNPRFAPIVEFEFDEDGRAVSFTMRASDDDIVGTGVRAGR